MTNLRSKLTRARNELEEYDDIPMLIPREVEEEELARETVNELVEELEEAKEERRQHALKSKSGTYHLIMCGIDHLEEHFKTAMREGSALPREEMEYAYMHFLESRARGQFDKRRTGVEMTNGKSLTAMKNYKYVTQGLLGMYEQGSKEHNWLKEKAPKW